jgi:hypothetical protein
MKTYNFYYKSRILKHVKFFKNFTEKYVTNVTDEECLIRLLQDKDYQNRQVIDIIYQNQFYQLIANENVQDVIDVLWNGSRPSNTNLLSFFSITQNLVNRNQRQENSSNFFFAFTDYSKKAAIFEG